MYLALIVSLLWEASNAQEICTVDGTFSYVFNGIGNVCMLQQIAEVLHATSLADGGKP